MASQLDLSEDAVEQPKDEPHNCERDDDRQSCQDHSQKCREQKDYAVEHRPDTCINVSQTFTSFYDS